MLTAFTSMGILPCLILERPVYVRERADGLYRPITYLAYKARRCVWGVGRGSGVVGGRAGQMHWAGLCAARKGS